MQHTVMINKQFTEPLACYYWSHLSAKLNSYHKMIIAKSASWNNLIQNNALGILAAIKVHTLKKFELLIVHKNHINYKNKITEKKLASPTLKQNYAV